MEKKLELAEKGDNEKYTHLYMLTAFQKWRFVSQIVKLSKGGG